MPQDINISMLVDGESAPIFPESGAISIQESMDFMVPAASMRFRDQLSTFVTVYPFLQDTEVQAYITDGEGDQKISFFAFSDAKWQMDNAVQEYYEYRLDLLSTYAHPLLTTSEFHSSRMKASDYIKYLADKLGLEHDVEETRDLRTWINPNWKYGQMLRYLAQRSISQKGSAGYQYYIRRDGVLVFKPVDAFFDNQSEGGDEEITLNLDSEVVDRDITMRMNNFSNVALGSNSLNLKYWDLTEQKYVDVDSSYDKYIKKRAIKQGISERFSKIGKTRYYRGVYKEIADDPSFLYTQLNKQALLQAESVQMEVTVEANMGRNVGDVVNISIPARDDVNQSGGVNMNYSGRYLIKSLVTYGDGDYYQKLSLMRPGMNLDKNRTGYY